MKWAFVAAMLVAAPTIRAEDEEEEVFEDDELEDEEEGLEDDLDDLDFMDEDVEEYNPFELKAAPGVTTSVKFANDIKIGKAGEPMTVSITVTNEGEEEYDLAFVGAHLHSPFDHSFYIMNFSVNALDERLDAEDSTTVEYSFMPDPTLEPVEFTLSGWVFYNNTDDTQIFRNYWFNETFSVEAADVEYTFRDLFTLVSLIGGIGFLSSIMFGESKTGQRLKTKLEGKEQTEKVEWTADDLQVYKPKASSRKIKSGSRRRK